MEIRKGEIVTLVGANGAGKSTTLRTIFGLTTIRGGHITFKGHEVAGSRHTTWCGWGSRLCRRSAAFFPR